MEGLKLGERIDRLFSRQVLPFMTLKKHPNMAVDKGWRWPASRLRWPYECVTEAEAARLGAALAAVKR